MASPNPNGCVYERVFWESKEPDGSRGWPPESRLIHDGRVVHLSVDRVRFPDGSEGELELIRHRGASAVVPFPGGSRGSGSPVVSGSPIPVCSRWVHL